MPPRGKAVPKRAMATAKKPAAVTKNLAKTPAKKPATVQKKSRALEFDKWVYEYMKPDWLTLGELEALQPGKELRAFVFDRNVGDFCFHECNKGPNKAEEPLVFFNNCTQVTFINNRTAEQTANKELWKGISYNMYGTMECEGGNYDLDLALPGWPARGKEVQVKSNGKTSAGDWSKLPKNSHLFCRGPMIMVSKMMRKGLPKVYWGDDDEDDGCRH